MLVNPSAETEVHGGDIVVVIADSAVDPRALR